MLKKKHIVITGPECSGKSVLAQELVSIFGAKLVPEFAREFLEAQSGEYERGDLRKIAFGQFSSQLSAMNSDSNLIISDTDLVTILIWDEVKYRQSDDFVLEWAGLQQVDYYLLCKPDIPWSYDPLRESPDSRDVLFEIYSRYIDDTNVPFGVIEGNNSDRISLAESLVKAFLAENK